QFGTRRTKGREMPEPAEPRRKEHKSVRKQSGTSGPEIPRTGRISRNCPKRSKNQNGTSGDEWMRSMRKTRQARELYEKLPRVIRGEVQKVKRA
ncbi:hypothetical protein KI387_006076, partial [Taxus chinensis]